MSLEMMIFVGLGIGYLITSWYMGKQERDRREEINQRLEKLE